MVNLSGSRGIRKIVLGGFDADVSAGPGHFVQPPDSCLRNDVLCPRLVLSLTFTALPRSWDAVASVVLSAFVILAMDALAGQKVRRRDRGGGC